MPKLTFADLEKKVRELVKEQPDFRYDVGENGRCLYNADETQPGCLFGQALSRLEVEIPESWEGDPISQVLRALGIKYNHVQQRWATSLQAYQDSGLPWAHALSQADELRWRLTLDI